jgi:hypothetical protein
MKIHTFENIIIPDSYQHRRFFKEFNKNIVIMNKDEFDEKSLIDKYIKKNIEKHNTFEDTDELSNEFIKLYAC